jgi:hypothetical protein
MRRGRLRWQRAGKSGLHRRRNLRRRPRSRAQNRWGWSVLTIMMKNVVTEEDDDEEDDDDDDKMKNLIKMIYLNPTLQIEKARAFCLFFFRSRRR